MEADRDWSGESSAAPAWRTLIEDIEVEAVCHPASA
jgi:hypothetical protein